MRQSMGVCRQVCSVVSAGSDACYVRTPYDDKSMKEIAGLLVRVQSEELYQQGCRAMIMEVRSIPGLFLRSTSNGLPWAARHTSLGNQACRQSRQGVYANSLSTRGLTSILLHLIGYCTGRSQSTLVGSTCRSSAEIDNNDDLAHVPVPSAIVAVRRRTAVHAGVA